LAKGIYKRGNTYWIRYAGPTGKMIFESTKDTSFKAADTLLLKRKQDVRNGVQPEILKNPDITFNDLADEYLRWAERQRGIRSKRGFIKQLRETFGGLQLKHITTLTLEQYQTERLQKGNIGTKGNKPATVNRHLSTLRHMFTKAVDWSMVSEDTLKRIRKAKQLPENNKRLRFLSKEECHDLLNACADASKRYSYSCQHLRAIVTTALHTGARRSEILGLRWDQVDLRHGFILFEGAMAKNGERREIPISETLRAALNSIVRRVDLPFVFYNPDTDKPLQELKKSFATAMKIAKISDFRFHDLRHTFASHLAMSGVELITIMKLLGHKDIKMTLRYAHLAPAQTKKAVNILDAALTGAADSAIQKLDSFPKAGGDTAG